MLLSNLPALLVGVQPVSYTHLDVYKRQVRALLAVSGCVLFGIGGVHEPGVHADGVLRQHREGADHNATASAENDGASARAARVRVSALTGEGLSDLKRALATLSLIHI